MHDKLKGVFSYAATLLAGIVIGVFTNSYVGFIEHNRTVIEDQFGAYKDTSSELLQLLDSYSTRARTGAKVDEETQKHFRQALLKVYSQAEAIEKREPRVHDEFADYAKSLLGLRDAASDFSGPLDARKFVEATSDYLHARSRFESKVTNLQRSYLQSLF
jgi:hypothetical protein